MRRLPVYLLLDTSGSMSGEPIEAVRSGVQMLVSSLRTDPQALEAAYLSVITFDTTARQIVPLTELTAFQMPHFEASGVTCFGEALNVLARCIDNEVRKTTPDSKGDWKPLVFVMTDGLPTDNWQSGLAEFKKRRCGIVVACMVGHAKTDVLQAVTESVVQLDTADSASLKAFFKWVSASIAVSSQKVESAQKEVGGLSELPPPPPEVNIVM